MCCCSMVILYNLYVCIGTSPILQFYNIFFHSRYSLLQVIKFREQKIKKKNEQELLRKPKKQRRKFNIMSFQLMRFTSSFSFFFLYFFHLHIFCCCFTHPPNPTYIFLAHLRTQFSSSITECAQCRRRIHNNIHTGTSHQSSLVNGDSLHLWNDGTSYNLHCVQKKCVCREICAEVIVYSKQEW